MPGMIPMFIVARRRRFYHSDVGGSGYSGERSSFSMQLSRTGVGSRLLWQEGCLLEPTAREAKERLDEKLLKSQRKSEMKITTTSAANTRLIKQVNQISHEDNNNMRTSSLAPASAVRRQLLPSGQQVRAATTTTSTATLTLEVLGSGLKRRFTVGAKKLVGRWAGSSSGGWKRLEEERRRQQQQQQECCVVCLDKLRDDNSDQKQVVTTLPCAHKFHSSCLLPWLHTNSHCPCCRTHISL